MIECQVLNPERLVYTDGPKQHYFIFTQDFWAALLCYACVLQLYKNKENWCIVRTFFKKRNFPDNTQHFFHQYNDSTTIMVFFINYETDEDAGKRVSGTGTKKIQDVLSCQETICMITHSNQLENLWLDLKLVLFFLGLKLVFFFLHKAHHHFFSLSFLGIDVHFALRFIGCIPQKVDTKSSFLTPFNQFWICIWLQVFTPNCLPERKRQKKKEKSDISGIIKFRH